MRIVDQAVMNRLFAVTDEIPIDREAITVPLGQEGTGIVRRRPDGRFEITLPDTDDLEPFLDGLPQALREAGYEAG